MSPPRRFRRRQAGTFRDVHSVASAGLEFLKCILYLPSHCAGPACATARHAAPLKLTAGRPACRPTRRRATAAGYSRAPVRSGAARRRQRTRPRSSRSPRTDAPCGRAPSSSRRKHSPSAPRDASRGGTVWITPPPRPACLLTPGPRRGHSGRSVGDAERQLYIFMYWAPLVDAGVKVSARVASVEQGGGGASPRITVRLSAGGAGAEDGCRSPGPAKAA